MDPELAAALVAIARRSAGAHYHRTDPVPGRSGAGSVDVLLATGSIRTGVADTLVDRLELWLAGPASGNLRRSLANEPAGTARHAFLVFDHRTEPEARSAAEQGAGFRPSRALQLPKEIDVVWILVGPVAGRYVPAEGWSTWIAPPPASSAA